MQKTRIRLIVIAIIVFAGFITLLNSAYVVKEGEQVVVTEFGKPVGKPITEAGLYFKVPFTQDANFFDKRYLEWDGDPNQLPTRDKKYIFVDTYARWQILDPLQFYKRLTNERNAQSRLDDIIDGETRNFVAQNYLVEVVRNENRKPVTDSTNGVLVDTLQHITVGREQIEKEVLASANKKVKDLGIVILDVRVKRVNYVEDVQKQVFARMRSERKRIADEFRSEGQGEASRINGQKDRELKSLQSEAYKTSEEIKGAADAQAAKIYADAYNQSPQSRDLYAFVKSMETFRNTFSNKTSVILSTHSELYKYLNDMQK